MENNFFLKATRSILLVGGSLSVLVSCDDDIVTKKNGNPEKGIDGNPEKEIDGNPEKGIDGNPEKEIDGNPEKEVEGEETFSEWLTEERIRKNYIAIYAIHDMIKERGEPLINALSDEDDSEIRKHIEMDFTVNDGGYYTVNSEWKLGFIYADSREKIFEGEDQVSELIYRLQGRDGDNFTFEGCGYLHSWYGEIRSFEQIFNEDICDPHVKRFLKYLFRNKITDKYGFI